LPNKVKHIDLKSPIQLRIGESLQVSLFLDNEDRMQIGKFPDDYTDVIVYVESVIHHFDKDGSFINSYIYTTPLFL
jgi:hypothetical protein